MVQPGLRRAVCLQELYPGGSIYTTSMELGPRRPSPLWLSGPDSIMVVHMDPPGILSVRILEGRFNTCLIRTFSAGV